MSRKAGAGGGLLVATGTDDEVAEKGVCGVVNVVALVSGACRDARGLGVPLKLRPRRSEGLGTPHGETTIFVGSDEIRNPRRA